MKITRLRLLGFKSFVEPTELLVEPGLTGVVGPNGCGKSNLLEALRWVMGETSYKTMRASAMDDVIFAGTQNRPARNMAEVTIFIDNAARKAPAEFNDSDVLEVTRRIEREAGSAYRVNGRDVRARDVRLLFEDAATGARSPALVRQGRIGEIINDKPQERRRVLEDAAGIAGLHSRRHEAELRLKAAEGNLERLQDLMGQMTTQLNSLKRQARQARRYKELSADLRRAEALHHHIKWTEACALVATSESDLQEVIRQVGVLTAAEAQALREQAAASEAVQPLRDEEATRAAVLHRLSVERDTLDAEEARARARQEELEDRGAELERDIARERDIAVEAEEVLARLGDEETGLRDAGPDSSDALEPARAAVAACSDDLSGAEATFSEATNVLADARARRRQLQETVDRQGERGTALQAQQQDTAARLQALDGESGADISGLKAELGRLTAALAGAETTAEQARAALAEAQQQQSDKGEAAARAAVRAQELETEIQTLRKLLQPPEQEQWLPIIRDVRAAQGYETALGAALGDDLDASADEAAPAHWRVNDGSGDPALPPGAEPLTRFVEAPAALARRLAQVGLVERGRGAALQADLKPGQRLVSKEGDLWRWDGYAATAEAPTSAARRLAERNRLDALTGEVEQARAAATEASVQHDATKDQAAHAEQAESQARAAAQAARMALDAARDALAAAEHAAQDSNAERAALAEAARRLVDDRDAAQAQESEARAGLAELPDEGSLSADLDAQRETVEEKRAAYAQARATLDGIERETRLREDRLAAIEQERARWTRRKASAGEQLETLGDRLDETREALAGFTDLPDRIAAQRSKILDGLTRAEAERQQAADALAEAQTARRTCDEAVREAQGRLATAREDQARIEARLEAARERRSDQAMLIAETLDCAPDACLALSGLETDAAVPPLEKVDTNIARLKADRERLGGVNLRAEEEVEEIAAELQAMETERADLDEAIARLRQGISSLNREGRKRLLGAFDEVNDHFKRLFKTLFGGGEAELQLVESDDPLESGLEILAQPPGKKPQVLTLLSGGEKALTALALIFAVFLTNPSPICVLDEVDAPLDDTNVERFCVLMNEMTRATDTRFLLITHHPMTMARMNRLFGVTMAERGVSQLVSVDLETAERFRDTG